MQAEGVGVGGLPGQIQAAGPELPGADRVLPVEAGDEVAAGVADHGDVQLAHKLQHVPAEAFFICVGMAGLKEPRVHTAAQMLHKGAVDPLVDGGNHIILVQYQTGFAHGATSLMPLKAAAVN